jgi:hypothetical protein
MRRHPPFVFALGLTLSLCVLPVDGRAEPHPYLQKASVRFRPLPPVSPAPHPDAAIHYVAGYELVAQGTDLLTGLSDIELFADGDHYRAEAISDYGAMARFDLRPDDKGGLADSELRLDPLHDEDGKPFYDKELGDSEDIAHDPATGARYVSFEGYQRVMRYADWAGRGETLVLSGLPPFPSNEGMEGLAYIRDKGGDSLLIGVEAGGFWRCDLADGTCREVQAPGPPGFLYKLTSLAVLDYGGHDHDILALYRYYDPFNGPRNILRLMKLDGDRLTTEATLLKIAPPLPYDNFEGVSAVRTKDGYRLYLISDGLHPQDRPKLLVFDWTAPAR